MGSHDEFIPTRQSLLGRLKNWEDAQSWQDFFDTYWRLIYSVARRAGLTEIESQEVVQETIIAVSKKMPGFSYDPALGSFKGWLLHMTRWKIGDQFRKRRPGQVTPDPLAEEEGRTALIERVPDPAGGELESVWNEEWQRNLMEAALARVKKKVKAQHYQVFDLYVVKQWPLEKITESLGVTSGQVYLIKHRISALLKEEVKALEKLES